ncbi:cupin [Actinomadura craniellae]|uniref:Cupin n=1 Tax=Actinomadura craniellae TaxID=2231787 RepID=A0A365HAU8_9ACTN|nr:cupin domain-containing protein [Actinomadura craniellae]RAY15393.1 cupin [Actinomadura craniellae]
MSLIPVDDTVVIRAADAEILGGSPHTLRLLADGGATAGALSALRVTLEDGADGAVPHHHTGATELLYVLGGTAHLLSGDDVLTAREGDLVIVPPYTPHAIAAAFGHDADLLVVSTPGTAGLGYFRLLDRLRDGLATIEELIDSQERFDTHFLDSPIWRVARA